MNNLPPYPSSPVDALSTPCLPPVDPLSTPCLPPVYPLSTSLLQAAFAALAGGGDGAARLEREP